MPPITRNLSVTWKVTSPYAAISTSRSFWSRSCIEPLGKTSGSKAAAQDWPNISAV
jgi:hypothetical protein